MKRVLTTGLIVLLVLGLIVAGFGCGQQNQGDAEQEQGQQQGQTETEKVKVIVGSETTYPPFEMVDEKGEKTGFDMELIRAIGEVENLDVEIQSMAFDGLIPALQAGTIDLAISAVTITEERAENVNFSDPYFDAGLIVAVPSTDTTVKGIADLEGKTIAVQIGTTGANKAKEVKGAKIKTFNTINEAFMEMTNGAADAVINDLPVTGYYIAQGHPEVKMVGDLLNGEQYGIAFNKSDTDLLAKVNDGLKKLKETGRYDEIYTKWFGEKSE
jgi:glutamine transport system substrate-binding protein